MASKKPKAAARKDAPRPTSSGRAQKCPCCRRPGIGSRTSSARRGARGAHEPPGWPRGRARRRSGRRLFFKADSRRLALKQELLSRSAGRGSFYPTPWVRLVITNRAGRIALKVYLARGQAEGVMVQAGTPATRAPWCGEVRPHRAAAGPKTGNV